MTLLIQLVAGVVAAIGSYLLARFVVIPLLRRRGVLDHPGERSSHETPVVRGGGIAVMGGTVLASVIGILVLGDTDGPHVMGLHVATALLSLVAAVAFGLLGFIDDLNSLSAIGRLVVQVLLASAVALLAYLTWEIPFVLAVGMVASIILSVNGTNFMDGLNTLVTVWGAMTAIWLMGWAFVAGDQPSAIVMVSFACALVGFLPLNCTPAASFLGDVGSYATGAFLAVAGWAVWAAGAPVIIVVAPFVVPMSDVVLTLCSRILRGEDIFTAHRSHVYQRLNSSGLSHERVSLVHLTFVVVSIVVALPAVLMPGWEMVAVTMCLWVIVVAIYTSIPRVVQHMTRRLVVG